MRRFFLILVVGTLLVSPLFVSAQLTGPLVPCDGVAGKDSTGKTIPECQACHVVQLGQNIINFLVAIAAVIAVVIFSYAGFLMLTAAGDTGKISSARGMFWNVLIGLVIVLAGWLIIDTVMKWAFQRQTDTDTEKGSPLYEAMKDKFGPWNQILCVTPVKSAASAPSATPPVATTPSPTPKPGTGVQCPPGSGCSVEALKATKLFTDAQADTFSCLAMAESTANPNAVNPKSKACGFFQILPSNWREPKNHRGDCSPATPCTNIACNIQTADLLSEAQPARASIYQPWICAGCDEWGKNRACVAEYDPKQNITI